MAPDGHITTREFDGFRDAVLEAITTAAGNSEKRFDAIDRRFDNAQKTTNDLLRIAGEQQSKLQDHERRLNAHSQLGHLHARKDDPAPATGDNEPLTMKDLKRAIWLAAAVVGLAITAIATMVSGVLDKP